MNHSLVNEWNVLYDVSKPCPLCVKNESLFTPTPANSVHKDSCERQPGQLCLLSDILICDLFIKEMNFENFEEALDDLYIRFILGLPSEEKHVFERLGFHIELAYWFYEDFVRPSNPSILPKHTFKSFGILLMQKFQNFLPHLNGLNLDELFSTFSAYKSKIPTYGAILINETNSKILLVKRMVFKTMGIP